MKEFLEKTLRQNVIMTENKEVYKKLPLAYCGRYDIFTVETNGVLWMAIHPKDNVGLVMLRRDRAGVEKMTGLNCAIFLDRTTFYIKAINEQISNFAQTYPTNLKASSNEALLFMRRYRFANCSCFSCCFKDAYPSSNVQ